MDKSGYLIWSRSYAERLDSAGQVTRSAAALLAEAWLTRLEEIPGRASMPEYWSSEEDVLERHFEQASRMSDKEILDQGLFASQPMAEALRRHGDYERAARLIEAMVGERLFPSIRTWAPNMQQVLAIMYLEADAGRTQPPCSNSCLSSSPPWSGRV